MAKPRSNLRLFVGIYPPSHITQRLLESLHALDLPAHRLTRTDQVHLTVQFIGDTPAAQLDATIESVQRATAGLRAFDLQPEKLITLPNRRGAPARLVAVECASHSTLTELHDRLARRLAANVRRTPGDRFLPHLTLCRFRVPKRMDAVERTVDVDAFPVRAAHLMRSTLLPGGAVHEVITEVELSD
jgi:2'-5' RNA ligase